MNTYKDNEKDELVDVKLPRSEYESLRLILEREKAYNWLTRHLKTNWLFVVGGGILTLWLLYDKIINSLIGSIR